MNRDWLLINADTPIRYNIARKRLDVLYAFTKQKRYDIYADASALKGVKKEWRALVIDPELYADGHIALPDIHDFILFAGMLPFLIGRRYGYFYAPGGSYSAKAIIYKPYLLNFQDGSYYKGDLVSLLFTVFVLSHFKAARESAWFAMVLTYLSRYKNENGRYQFPLHMVTEKPDSYVVFGGHMNAGENKKAKLYNEVISTYWMERVQA